MSEETRIYNFENYVTSSQNIAEVFFYLKQMQAQCAVLPAETHKSLVEKQMAVSGFASRIKVSLKQFMQEAYQADPNQISQKTNANQVMTVLDEIKATTFYLHEAALHLSEEQLRRNLHHAAVLSAKIPAMVAALDAGEDEVK